MRYLVLLALLIVPTASAQTWSAVPPPATVPYATDFAAHHPDTVVMVRADIFLSSHVVRSTNGGRSWQRVSGDGRSLSHAISFPGGWAAISEYGWFSRPNDSLLVSRGDGTSSRLRPLPGGARRASCLRALGTDSLLVGVNVTVGDINVDGEVTALALYVGDRTGQTWRSLGTPRLGWRGCDVSAEGAIVGTAASYVERSAGGLMNILVGVIERTQDRGATWDTLSLVRGGEQQFVTSPVAALGADTLLVEYEGSLLRTTDDGASWQTVLAPSTSLRQRSLGVRAEPSGLLSATNESSMFLSADRGASWDPVDLGQIRIREGFEPPSVSAFLSRTRGDLLVATSTPGEFACVTKKGSSPSGPFWSAFDNAFGILYRGAPDALAPDPNAPVGYVGFAALSSLGSAPSSVGIQDGFRQPSLTCGFQWSPPYGRAEFQVTGTPVLFAQSGVALAAVVRDGGALRLVPEATFASDVPDLSSWRAMTFSGTSFYAVSDLRVWTRAEEANAWSVLADLSPNTDATSIAGVASGVLVGLSDGRIARYVDGKWQNVYGGRGGLARVVGMERSRGRVSAWGVGGAVLTTDDGDTWSVLGRGLETREVTDLLTLGPDRYLAATDDGIWELTGRDELWTRAPDAPDTDAPIAALQLFKSAGFCQDDTQPCPPTSYQVIAYTERQAYIGYDLGSEFTSTPTQTTTALSLGAPTPTPSSSGVRFNLSTPSPATLEAYDLLGRRVWQTDVGPSAQSAEWNGMGEAGSRVSAGVYLIVLRSDSQTRTTRAVLL